MHGLVETSILFPADCCTRRQVTATEVSRLCCSQAYVHDSMQDPGMSATYINFRIGLQGKGCKLGSLFVGSFERDGRPRAAEVEDETL